MRSKILALTLVLLGATVAIGEAGDTDQERFEKLAGKYVLNENSPFKPKIVCVCTELGQPGLGLPGYLFRSVMFPTGIRCAVPNFDEAGTFSGSSSLCQQFEILPK